MNTTTSYAHLAGVGLCRDENGGVSRRNPVLDSLEEQRRTAFATVDTILAAAQNREGGLSDSDKATLTETRAAITKLDEQIEPIAQLEQLRANNSEAVRAYRPGGAPAGGDEGRQSLGFEVKEPEHKYRSAGEAIVDLLMANPINNGRQAPGRGAIRIGDEQRAAAQQRMMGARMGFEGMPDDYARAVAKQTTTETPGLLPVPIVGDVLNDVDATRPFINSIGAKDLGVIPGTTFKRPQVTQHTKVDKQSAEKAELASRQFKVGSVDFAKETAGGTLNISRQEIDWTSPSAWDAILTDLTDEYGIYTEETAVAAFVASLTAGTGVPDAIEVGSDSLKGWAFALFSAAAGSYGSIKRLPNHVWVSLDMWAAMGSIVDVARLSLRGGENSAMGNSSPGSFEGSVLDLPRTVVPSFPEGTIVVGSTRYVEFYEERIGLLQAIEPSILGVEVAYGGYYANGTLKRDAFRRITGPTPDVAGG